MISTRETVVHIQLPIEANAQLPLGDPRKGISHNFIRSQLPPGHRQLALIAFGEREYRAIGIVDKESATSSFQDRVRCSFIREIPPLPFDSIVELVPRRLTPKVRRNVDQEIGAFSFPGGNAVLRAAVSIEPSVGETIREVLSHLERVQIISIRENSPWVVVRQELDAVDTALELAGMAPARIEARDLDPDHPAPVLGLLSPHAREDSQIDLDANAFGGLTLLQADTRGAKSFFDPHSGSRVTVVNVNRQPLEHTLGVDLVIYYSKFRSYLLVQYKRLTNTRPSVNSRVNGAKIPDARFYPARDRNFAHELERMIRVKEAIGDQTLSSPEDYRLNDDPFYFKFCRSDSIDPDSMGMVKGLYILAQDLKHFLSSEASKGIGSGHSIGFDNLRRRFPNSLFLDLAKTGWIGSRKIGSERIDQYIRDALGTGRSVMLAEVRTRATGNASERADENLQGNSTSSENEEWF